MARVYRFPIKTNLVKVTWIFILIFPAALWPWRRLFDSLIDPEVARSIDNRVGIIELLVGNNGLCGVELDGPVCQQERRLGIYTNQA